MGADGATSREGAAESRRRRRCRRRRGTTRAGRRERTRERTYCKYLPLTCHEVFSTSGNFVNVNGARGLADIIHNCCTSSRSTCDNFAPIFEK